MCQNTWITKLHVEKTLTVKDNYWTTWYTVMQSILIHSLAIIYNVDIIVMMIIVLVSRTVYRLPWRDRLISSIRNTWAGKFKLNVGLIRSCESSYFPRNLIRVFSMRCFNYPKEDQRLIYHRAMHSQVVLGKMSGRYLYSTGKLMNCTRICILNSQFN